MAGVKEKTCHNPRACNKLKFSSTYSRKEILENTAIPPNIIYQCPICFEKIISDNMEAMTWFLMNVLRKTSLYFEPPSQGYGRSSIDIVSRFIIRILAYRIRHGIVVTEKKGRKKRK